MPTELDKLAEGKSREDWFAAYIAAAEGGGGPLAFPSEDMQRRTNGLAGRNTATAAIEIYQVLLRGLEAVGVADPTGLRVLDYGCGWGRITRLMPHGFGPGNVVGVDVDAPLVDAARRCVPDIAFEQIASMTPMPMADGSFDVIFANSVFSHLSARSHAFAMAEFHRLLGKDGIVVASTLGRPNLVRFYENRPDWIGQVLGPRDPALATLDSEGFVYKSTGRWEDYGIAACTEDWVRDTWAKAGFDWTCMVGNDSRDGGQRYQVARKS